MKILAVDDDPIILELLSEVLRVVGFTNLTLCSSSSEALALVERAEVPFDCFLLDIQMPDMNGIQLTSAIRAMPRHAKTPILMITAMSDRTYIDNAFAAGASDYITKPFEIGEVHARLRLINALVQEWKQKDDRNPVYNLGEPASIVTNDDLSKPLSLLDIDGFIEYLALENYLLQMSRVSLFGMSAFGVVVPDMERTFSASSVFEFESAITDIAEAMSDTLKPRQFLAAHAGGGQFVCVLSGEGQFAPTDFQASLRGAIREMDLHFCDGRPMSFNPVVGPDISLQLKSSRGVASALVQAMLDAESIARDPSTRDVETPSSFKRLLGF